VRQNGYNAKKSVPNHDGHISLCVFSFESLIFSFVLRILEANQHFIQRRIVHHLHDRSKTILHPKPITNGSNEPLKPTSRQISRFNLDINDEEIIFADLDAVTSSL
jgi:hypothetical protein